MSNDRTTLVARLNNIHGSPMISEWINQQVLVGDYDRGLDMVVRWYQSSEDLPSTEALPPIIEPMLFGYAPPHFNAVQLIIPFTSGKVGYQVCLDRALEDLKEAVGKFSTSTNSLDFCGIDCKTYPPNSKYEFGYLRLILFVEHPLFHALSQAGWTMRTQNN